MSGGDCGRREGVWAVRGETVAANIQIKRAEREMYVRNLVMNPPRDRHQKKQAQYTGLNFQQVPNLGGAP
jgi:hypothetical protein